jgi:hypothetical protein
MQLLIRLWVLIQFKIRKYRGFKREQQYFDQVRAEYLAKKSELMDMVASFESDFSDPKEYQNMFEFMGIFLRCSRRRRKIRKSNCSRGPN